MLMRLQDKSVQFQTQSNLILFFGYVQLCTAGLSKEETRYGKNEFYNQTVCF